MTAHLMMTKVMWMTLVILMMKEERLTVIPSQGKKLQNRVRSLLSLTSVLLAKFTQYSVYQNMKRIICLGPEHE